ncbi:hypothetical protein [Dysgonomonas sp. ZJ709]|uniref:hypothetical protein n=1 Tax=Dysgonomonas sp. ZJ709 TaxID=2709797 RepID=UPI0013EAFC3D|nr:hypothetical protein [Dysgonomonas sp. ZJ709]
MIETQVKIHDNFSVEFKTGFITNNKTKDINEFKINTWIFIPNGLDINRATYSKEQFYRDVKSNIRLITPIYSLDDILKAGRGPLPRLQKALDALSIDPTNDIKKEDYLYQVKMLLCIMKSALRREAQIIANTADDKEVIHLVNRYVSQVEAIALEYREKWEMLTRPEISQEQRNYYLFGDNFLGNIIEQHTFDIMRKLNSRSVIQSINPILNKLLIGEIDHKKKRGFSTLEEGNEEHNSLIITQRNILKKFVESDLFLQIVKKKDGAFAEQMYYSIAAGVAMIFATVISFFATQRYGNFTTDLFVVLVISYMLKDRIKDLMRYYFSSELSKKYFDTKLKLSIRKQEIGWLKESFDFVEESKVSSEVLNMRNRSPLVEAENQTYNEQIILYRKWVNLSKDEIEKYKEYRLSGINDITRFNLFHFVQKMDNPSIPLYVVDKDKGFSSFEGTRIYPLYFVVQCESDTDKYYKTYRLLFNRNGITSVSELD